MAARAQIGTVEWTTNYYTVTGATFREIRQSIAANKPWKNDVYEGDTRWSVSWKFEVRPTLNGCTCSSYNTATKIVTTLPRWKPSSNAPPEMASEWSRHFVGLAEHESGHARIGLAAAARVRDAIAKAGASRDCDALQAEINKRANAMVEDQRRREVEYDRMTEHGAKPMPPR